MYFWSDMTIHCIQFKILLVCCQPHTLETCGHDTQGHNTMSHQGLSGRAFAPELHLHCQTFSRINVTFK